MILDAPEVAIGDIDFSVARKRELEDVGQGLPSANELPRFGAYMDIQNTIWLIQDKRSKRSPVSSPERQRPSFSRGHLHFRFHRRRRHGRLRQ